MPKFGTRVYYPQRARAGVMGQRNWWAATNENTWPTIHTYCRSGNARAVRDYISRGGDLERELGIKSIRMRPLHIACMHKRLKIAKLLIDAGADVNALTEVGDTPLHFAVRRHDLNMVCLLLDHGADPNGRRSELDAWIQWTSVMELAIREADLDIIRLLVERGATVDDVTIGYAAGIKRIGRSPSTTEEIMELLEELRPDAVMEYWIGQGPGWDAQV